MWLAGHADSKRTPIVTGKPKGVRVGATIITEPPAPRSPACWRWKPMTPVIITGLLEPYPPEYWSQLSAHQQQWLLMRGWHRGRCAICATTLARLVEDHNHETGLTRGFLCQSCNVREGYRWHGVYDKYRERNPASILAISIPYVDPVTGLAAKPVRVVTQEEEEERMYLRRIELEWALFGTGPLADPSA